MARLYRPGGEAGLSAEFPYRKRRIPVLGRMMAVVEAGEGDPIVLLHGNPTSSYIWRNVIPHIQALGRCIAPDLIGMGDSDKLPDSGSGSYTFKEHRRHLDEMLDALDVRENVTLVVHDWGSALGFDWARRHPESVRAIAYLEALVRPTSWVEFPDRARELFQALRSPAGETMVLEQNFFVEQVLPGGVLRTLTDEEMEWYRGPFAGPGEDRRPTLSWPREIPIDGKPAEVADIVQRYADWLSRSSVPKLFINGEPGLVLTGPSRDFCRTWPCQHEVAVPGLHFLQEDSPGDIGRAIADWVVAMPRSDSDTPSV
jgi:haloalkane dehalogenase